MLKTSLLGLNGQLSIRSPKSVHTCSTEADQSRIPTSIRRRRSGGFTLLEVLIATAVTMLMMLGLAQIFRVLGESMSQGRAGLELNNRLRSVMHRIRTDLDNVTVTPHPPITVGTAQGYLKYYEGPCHDYSIAYSLPIPMPPEPIQLNEMNTRLGDVDDIFMATVKAKDTWFTGKVPRFIAERRDPTAQDQDRDSKVDDFEPENSVTISSQFAEVAIFTQPLDNDNDGFPDSYRLHYRTLLIRPDLNVPPPGNNGERSPGNLPGDLRGPAANSIISSALDLPEPSSVFDMFGIHQICDLSIRRDLTGPLGIARVTANTLEDLANPINRFAHVTTSNSIYTTMPELSLSDPLPFQRLSTNRTAIPGTGFLNREYVLQGDRTGEDLLTSDVLAFDIRAYDSSAPVFQYPTSGTAETTLRPGDPGFENLFRLGSALPSPVAYGEFVDLNWAGRIGARYVSELSGVDADGNPTNALFKSGLVKRSSNGFQIFQPSYDTYTNLYESDGVLQAQIAGQPGLVTITGGGATLTEPWRATAIDAGTDGVDNAGSAPGVDDPSERETSPPFPVDLRGLQISVRLEDPTKKQFKQMSTVKQFVTN